MNSNIFDLIDLDTFVSLKKAAPKVTQLPWDAARMVAHALSEFARVNGMHEDLNGKKYWTGAYKEIHAVGRLGEDLSMQTVGTACRTMGLTIWRETDGYHAAWSEEQLKIIKRYFKL